ncbi:MAG: O-antigen ligase family protein, partial [Ilumatobacteraceae bacterium]
AAVVALVTALIVFTIILFWRQRRTFWKVVPIGAIVVIGYLGAFWTSESSAGFPAQAVKSVIAPNSMSAKDQSSNEYRRIENFNLSYTIRSSPITGLGFGQPFLRPVQLPDISGFEFNAYLPHNSLLWIWIKLGFAGFVTVLYLLARSLSLGARRIRDAAPGLDLFIASNAAMFVVMYAVYIFVDVAWEARNVTLMALAMGLCTGHLIGERSDDQNQAETDPDSTDPDATDPLPVMEPSGASGPPASARAHSARRQHVRPPTRVPVPPTQR